MWIALAAAPTLAVAENAAPLTMQDVQISYSAPAEKFFPTLVRIHGVKGGATLRCLIGSDGGLSACVKVKEDPVGMGYLTATKAMAGVAQIEANARDGSPTAGRTLLFERRFDFCRGAVCDRDARTRWEAAGREY